MKTSRLFTLSGIIFITLSITGCNNNPGQVICPPIPENANFLTLKENLVVIFLGKSAQGTPVKLSKGYRLNSLNQTAQKTEGSEIDNCKYQAELTSDIKENLTQNKNTTQGSFWIEKKFIEDFPNNNLSLQFLLPLVLSIIQVIIAIVLFILLLGINANQKRSSQKIKETINQSYNQLLSQIPTKNDSQLDSYYQRTKVKFKGLSEQIIELKELNFSALSVPKSPLVSNPVSNDFPVATTSSYSSYADIILPSQNNDSARIVNQQLDEIIANFNSHNKAYFNNPQFQPLNPSKVSSQGFLEEDGSRMIQLEVLNDITQALFLTFLLDKDNWLIPNAASPHLGNIIKILEEYPEIFSMKSGTGKPTLIQPAKLKNSDSGFWEIAEVGEFQY